MNGEQGRRRRRVTSPEHRYAAPLAPALSLVALITLCGCTSGSGTDQPTAVGVTSTSGRTTSASPSDGSATGSATGTGSLAPTAAAPTGSATGLPTSFVTVEQSVTDPDLGHQVAVHRIARSVPWPAGHAAEAAAFELVAVELTWTSGTAFTSSIRARDFALVTGSTYPNRVDPLVDPVLTAAGWAILPGELPAGQTATGWLVFRVDPRDAPMIRLDWTRPATKISGTSTIFPKTLLSVALVPVPGVSTSAAPVTSTSARTTTKARTTTRRT